MLKLGLSSVQEMGIAAADIKKLREASYHVIEAVAHATKRELLLVKGLSEAKVNKIKEAGRRPFTPRAQERWLLMMSCLQASRMVLGAMIALQTLMLGVACVCCSRKELLHGLRDSDRNRHATA